MKSILTLLVAAFAVAISSCCQTGKCSPGKNEPPCSACQPQKATPVVAATCSNPMSPDCRGGCSPQACFCKPQKCACAPKVVVAKPKTVVKRAVVAPSPPPAPPKIAVAAPADPTKVKEGVYYWEFSDPANRATLPAGANATAAGFITNPKTKGWSVVREYEVPSGPQKP